MLKFLTGIFGSRNQRLIKEYSKKVSKINVLEERMQGLDEAAMHARTAELKAEVAAGKGLDEVLPEAFAMVREASVRTLGLRHFDEQLIGGMVLHEGKIAEMRTGEGKTLVATLPAYLNALSGNGVHIVTVNEYLARRDAEWMGPVYRALGLTVGVIQANQPPDEKRAAYASDITYGTNNEFGFDYLRDNLAFSLEQRAQHGLNFAVVDEVDSILIDEARTPLIISGPAEDSTDTYLRVNQLVPALEVVVEKDGPGDFTVDEKSRQVYLTEAGHARVEELMAKAGLIKPGQSLYDAGNIMLMQHLSAALRAHAVYRRDVEYIVKDGEVVIVDEFTGRTMPGRRWSDGLHQAIEAKEGVKIRQENQTLASITFQNFFRMYQTLSGMTGTADTEAFEFMQIYGLEVVVVPTHMPMIRKDNPDLVYLTKKDKFEAILEDIRDCQQRGQPVLVGTTSIETSELLSGILKKEKLTHEVLNAKQHAREAEIVAEAGRAGAITIATNMAGRGTDIVLGGNFKPALDAAGDDEELKARVHEEWKGRHQVVLDAGGLHIIGTERHESRRIDNQLRGRSGRQGDPGSSRFYLSMEDNLMRIFGEPEKTKALLARVGMKEGEVIESKLLSRQIERAQRKVEAHNFDIRKQLLKYDDVANDQRKVIYGQRTELMEAEEIGDSIAGIREEVVNNLCERFVPGDSVEEQWDLEGLEKQVEVDFGFKMELAEWVKSDASADPEAIRARVLKAADDYYEAKVEQIGAPIMRHFEKAVMLQQLDVAWKEHLAAMDYLRQGIHLRGYAQKNPEQEYKREAFQMFSEMLDRVKRDVISIVSRVQIRTEEEVEALERKRRDAAATKMRLEHAQVQSAVAGGAGPAGPVADPFAAGRREAPEPVETFVREQPKVGRNEPCPCGSGKKYKQCHGKLS